MAMQHGSAFCKVCGEQRKKERAGTNHLLHLILSIITVGFWLPVWLLVSIKFGGWRCSTCGSKKLSRFNR